MKILYNFIAIVNFGFIRNWVSLIPMVSNSILLHVVEVIHKHISHPTYIYIYIPRTPLLDYKELVMDQTRKNSLQFN